MNLRPHSYHSRAAMKIILFRPININRLLASLMEWADHATLVSLARTYKASLPSREQQCHTLIQWFSHLMCDICSITAYSNYMLCYFRCLCCRLLVHFFFLLENKDWERDSYIPVVTESEAVSRFILKLLSSEFSTTSLGIVTTCLAVWTPSAKCLGGCDGSSGGLYCLSTTSITLWTALTIYSMIQ